MRSEFEVFVACANFSGDGSLWLHNSPRPFLTTKHTKATKGSDNHDFKLRVLRASFENTPFGYENEEARLGSVIPAKAGIQANSAQQTWIPPVEFWPVLHGAGMTSRGGHHVEGNPSIFILGGRA